MPLDNTPWQVPQPHLTALLMRLDEIDWRRRKRRKMLLLFAFWVVIAGSFVSEIIWPKAGIITRIIYGNAIANENLIVARLASDAHRLNFTVAGHYYQVVTPRGTPTPEQQAAWFNYNIRHGFPLYSTDGPFAVDP
jgi:hypothetical protein